MKRIVRTTGALAAVAALFASAPARAGDGAAHIEFGDNYFDPQTSAVVAVRPHGPEAVWARAESAAENHNVVQDDGLFTSGRPKVFDQYSEDISAGTWHYYCRVHGSVLGGMDGVLAVAPVADRANGETARVRWADNTASTGNRYEVEYRAAGEKWKPWKASTKERALEFGSGSPVAADPHATYDVRVRSFASNDPSRRSDWSPRVSFSVAGD